MNKFFRAIGFTSPMTAAGLQSLVNEVLSAPDFRAYTTNGDDTLLAEFRMDFGEHCGVAVCGEFDANDQFRYEYCYPYCISDTISTVQTISVEPQIRQEGYLGVCDDFKVGVTLIFHVQDMVEYVKRYGAGNYTEEIRGVSVSLSSLSSEGVVMMPIQKSESDIRQTKRNSVKRTRMIKDAMAGDEAAMESLTIEDMDTYAAISRQIQTEDIYTLVDSYFMPFGVECDMYSVLGEIISVETTSNRVTGEEIVRMLVSCNDLKFSVCINQADLYGEPAPGRRFKGVVWMQGMLHFQENLNF